MTITGDGVAKTKMYTQSQLEAMPQVQEVQLLTPGPPRNGMWAEGCTELSAWPKEADIKSGHND